MMSTRYCNPKRWSEGTCERNMVGFIFSSRRFTWKKRCGEVRALRKENVQVFIQTVSQKRDGCS
jgi:hypothetical protein